MKRSRQIGLMMIISGATLWGISGPMIQWLFQKTSLTSADYLVIRLIVAGIILLSFLFLSKHDVFTIWKHPGQAFQLIIFSVLGMLGAQYAFIETVYISNAVTATLFQFLGPVLIMVWVATLNRKWPSSMQFMALFAALAGVYYLITDGSVQDIVLSKKAILFGGLTALGFMFYTLHPASLIKRWGTSIVVGWGMLIGGIVLYVANPGFNLSEISGSFTLQISFMLLLIILSGTISFVLYIGSLKYLSAVETSLLSSIEPLVAAILSITWLNESFGMYQLLGGAFIVMAVIFLAIPEKETSAMKEKFS
ncbi:DMT family transporter [Fictibacillus phosphorivorans]|uniref:DMT family transporter n=1 Tax=Fictibacillus phosphorivorans TaxID=1221500 RepID=UPI00203C3CBF|nr:DMT family transporter [Fictibacillus phosphorivorans]MCM3718310.1 DMT family transporter [Fictibacillus phosphorivorans]MCM3775826.1 DMT family transporter [Fictibacillus phosphorivorans]